MSSLLSVLIPVFKNKTKNNYPRCEYVQQSLGNIFPSMQQNSSGSKSQSVHGAPDVLGAGGPQLNQQHFNVGALGRQTKKQRKQKHFQKIGIF